MSEEGNTPWWGFELTSLLEKHGRSFYWLAKETGVSHTTLWRLKKGKAYRDQLRNFGEGLPRA